MSEFSYTELHISFFPVTHTFILFLFLSCFFFYSFLPVTFLSVTFFHHIVTFFSCYLFSCYFFPGQNCYFFPVSLSPYRLLHIFLLLFFPVIFLPKTVTFFLLPFFLLLSFRAPMKTAHRHSMDINRYADIIYQNVSRVTAGS